MTPVTRARNLKGKVALVRVDFNVPIERKKILDDSRLTAALPTIEYLSSHGAKVILITHIGRPNGKVALSAKVDPVVDRLSTLLKKKVKKLETRNWKLSPAKKQEIKKQIRRLRDGQVAMMENIRFSPREEGDIEAFGAELASYGDLFVLDGFGVAHRESASVTGIAAHIKSYAGLLLTQEVKGLQTLLKSKKDPFVAILGGIKIETKLPLIRHLLPLADAILIGGGIVNTYLAAKGYGVGTSIIDADYQLAAITQCKRKKVIKPVDVVVGTKDGKRVRVVPIQKIPHELCKKDEGIFDVGPETLRRYAAHIKSAKRLVWNGALGYFEQPPYHIGTHTMARLVASRSKGSAYGVIGGGETLLAMDAVGMMDDIDFVSTGGGAMLEYLSGKTLPGLAALSQKK